MMTNQHNSLENPLAYFEKSALGTDPGGGAVGVPYGDRPPGEIVPGQDSPLARFPRSNNRL
jgi:hypothetical protein